MENNLYMLKYGDTATLICDYDLERLQGILHRHYLFITAEVPIDNPWSKPHITYEKGKRLSYYHDGGSYVNTLSISKIAK